MKTQVPLLVLYAVFVIGSLLYLHHAETWVHSTQFAPGAYDRLREGASRIQSLDTAHRAMAAYIGLMEDAERLHAESARMNRIYVWFAIALTLPLAGYSGRAMREKLFVTRPAGMPRLVYWTLWGVSTRREAVRYMWVSVLFAFGAIAISFVNPIGFLGAAALVTAACYHHAVRWVDRNAYWAHETAAPFPLR